MMVYKDLVFDREEDECVDGLRSQSGHKEGDNLSIRFFTDGPTVREDI